MCQDTVLVGHVCIESENVPLIGRKLIGSIPMLLLLSESPQRLEYNVSLNVLA